VPTVVIPRKGKPGKARQAREHRPAFRRTVKWRTGSETSRGPSCRRRPPALLRVDISAEVLAPTEIDTAVGLELQEIHRAAEPGSAGPLSGWVAQQDSPGR
jgi:hypothetical protein